MKGLGGQEQICGHHVVLSDPAVGVDSCWVLVEGESCRLSRSTMRGLFPTVCCCQGREG